MIINLNQTKMKKLAVLFCICIIIFGCTSSPKIDVTVETNTILDLENQWIAANKSKDLDKIMTYNSPEVVMIVPNSPNYEGLQRVKEYWGSAFADTTLLWETYSAAIDKIEVAASGDLAYVRGVGQMNYHTPEGIKEFVGNFVEIWKKIDGHWKFELGIVNYR